MFNISEQKAGNKVNRKIIEEYTTVFPGKHKEQKTFEPSCTEAMFRQYGDSNKSLRCVETLINDVFKSNFYRQHLSCWERERERERESERDKNPSALF